jgi:hypothetical protein
MRREWIAVMVVAAALIGLVMLSISQENARRAGMADTLLTVNPIEDPGGLTPTQGYTQPPRQSGGTTAPRRSSFGTVTLPAGSGVPVRVNATLSSEHAGVGDTWTGVVSDNVYADGGLVIPAGSSVSGTVAAVQPAERGERAMIQLGLSRVSIGGQSYRVRGRSEPLVAGSPRARNVGAIAGGTAAGAVVGKAVSGSNKGALIGGLLGGAAATGVVAKSKGWQAVIKEGSTVSFTTSASMAVSKRAVAAG